MQSKAIKDFERRLCISKMQEDHIAIWKYMAEIVREKLDNIPILRETAFTPHDFSNHCYNIYKIISNVLIINYDNNTLLSSEALLLLNISVLFHDYAMTDANFDRLTHSADSARMFEAFCSQGDITHGLTPKQIAIIKNIIEAHSDIKEETPHGIKVKKQTLLETVKKGKVSGTIEDEICTPLLAGLLRLADELDITSDRAGGYISQLRKLNTEAPAQLFSRDSWVKLLYFDSVSRDKDYNIVLTVNDGMYSSDTIRGDEIVISVAEKIQKEFCEIRDTAFRGEARTIVACNGVLVKINDLLRGTGDFLTKDNKGMGHLAKKDVSKEVEDLTSSNNSRIEYTLLSTDISMKLDKLIYDNGLFVGGHYNINDSFCTRDWIKTADLVFNKEARVLITKEIVAKISASMDENVLFAGIEISGSIIASAVAYSINKPFSYIIPNKSKDNNSMQDRKFSADGYSTVVLFTDVIVSLETIKKVIENNRLKNKKLIIYSLFLRPICNTEEDILANISFDDIKSNQIIPKIIVLNDRFETTLFPKGRCPMISLCNRVQNSEYSCIDCRKISV